LVDRDSEITDVGQATSGDLCLIVLEETGLVRYSLPPTGTISVGRAETADVCLSDRLASRRHLLLHVGETLAVEDTNSANGTRVRGEVIPPGRHIRVDVGEVIYVGAAMLVVRSVQWNRPTPPRAIVVRAGGSREVEGLKLLRALENAHAKPDRSHFAEDEVPRRGRVK
jgi:hypothetical protein